MIKDEAFEILIKKRTSEWNKYRKKHPKWEPDLSNCEFPDCDLRGMNLSYADLRGADLYYADLRGTKLSHADLRGADLSNAKLKSFWADANLRKAKYNIKTKWPPGFNPADHGAVLKDDKQLTQMAKVFISYAGADKDIVRAIDQWLRNKGIKVKIDERNFFAGSKIRDEIVRVMQKCDAVIIFYSEASKNKPWPEFERELASDLEMEAKKEGRKPPRIIYIVNGELELPSITERNRLAIFTLGKFFPDVCEEIYCGIMGLSRPPQTINLKRWEDFRF